MQLTSLDEALNAIPDGARMVAGSACGTPTTLLSGLDGLAARRRELTLSAGLLFGGYSFEAAVRSGALRFRCWHVHDLGRRWWREGLVEYFPARSSDVTDVLASSVDVALIRVGAPDAQGWCSLGPSASFVSELVSSSRLVIAEVSENIPCVTGSAGRVHVTDITRATRATAPPPSYTSSIPDERASQVARRALDVIPQGATVQLGIGAITDAMTPLLEPVAGPLDLGLLGMLTEAMIPLAQAIIGNGRGPVRVVEALGGEPLLAFLHRNPGIEFCTASTLLDPRTLGSTPRLISVNSAMAVDVRGQVVAETAAGNVISGIGGSADFFDGARLSAGGLRVIALPSMRRGASTIVSHHSADELVAIPHYAADAVVTEHGVAWLRGKSSRERAEALIRVADPCVREGLRHRELTRASKNGGGQ